jgi:hypothetical protein
VEAVRRPFAATDEATSGLEPAQVRATLVDHASYDGSTWWNEVLQITLDH